MAKLRLSAVLSEPDRERLVRAMLDHVLTTVAGVAEVDEVAVIGGRGIETGPQVRRIADHGDGLNAALQAMLDSQGRRPGRLIVIHGDLPRLSGAEVRRLAVVRQGAMAIAPDRHGAGTNALSLPLPAAGRFRFAFGPGSCARHLAEAERLMLPVEVVVSNGLGCDIDEPSDLARLDPGNLGLNRAPWMTST